MNDLSRFEERPRGVHPFVFGLLYFPMGLMIGFPSVALGYLGVKAGLPVSSIAGIVGAAFFAHSLKFLWAPIGDYSLSRKSWYLLAASAVSIGILAITVVPIAPSTVGILTLLVFGCNFAATFIAFATEGLMAHNTTVNSRGRAAGWFQSGNQLGQTAGGAAGLFLMKRFSEPWMAGATLAGVVMLCACGLLLLEEPPRAMTGGGVSERLSDAWGELATLLRSRVGRLALLLAILPIGTGSAQFLFGSIGPEWHASADVVSLVLALGGGAIVIGCFAGGWMADAMRKPTAYAVACGAGVVAAAFIAFSPRNATGYTLATLFYSFTLGLCTATMTGMVLAIIGERAAATKINVFFAMNTLFSLGVLRVMGYVHDRWSANVMLYFEAGLGALALLAFAVVAARIRDADRAD